MLKTLWFSLIQPASHITDSTARRNSQLLASLLLVIAAVVFAGVLLPYLTAGGTYPVFGNDLLFFILVFSVTVLSYYSCRRLNYKIATWIVITFLGGTIIISAYPDGSPSELNLYSYYLVPILISGLFLSIRAATLVTLVGIISMSIMGLLLPDVTGSRILLGIGQYLLLVASLTILSMYHRNQIEHDRQEKIITNEQQLRLITNNIQEGICLTDLQGNIRYLSPAFQKQTQLQIDDITSVYDIRYRERLHPDDMEPVRISLETTVNAGTPTYVEYRFRVGNGDYQWLESNFTLLLDANNRPDGIVMVCRNVQQRKGIEDALARERNLLRTLIDNLPDQIYAKDRESRLVLSNNANTRCLGADSESELLGTTDFDRFPPELAQGYRADDIQVIETGIPLLEKEEVSYHVNTGANWVMTTKVPLYNPDGEIVGLVGSSRDITQRKKIEQQLLEAEKLHVALEKEKELSVLKTQFMRTISHELRTPLATILTSSELIERYESRLSPERRKECLVTIRVQVGQLNEMLQDISTVIRVEDDEIVFEPRLVNIETFCREIISEIQLTMNTSRQIDLVLEGSFDEVGADKRLLRHILLNLLRNAIKYSVDQTPVTLEVKREGSHIALTVADQGIGICPEDRPRLFESFFRGSNIGNIGGTGLGLKIVNDCVAIYKGTITLESEENVGSRFTVRLPTTITE